MDWTFEGYVCEKTILPSADAQFKIHNAKYEYIGDDLSFLREAFLRVIICRRSYADKCLHNAGMNPKHFFSEDNEGRFGWIEHWRNPHQAFAVFSAPDCVLDEVWQDLTSALQGHALKASIKASGRFSPFESVPELMQPVIAEFEAGKLLRLQDWSLKLLWSEDEKA